MNDDRRPNTVTCRCGKNYVAHENLAGRTLKCPACGAFLRFPESVRSAAECAADLLESYAKETVWDEPAGPERHRLALAKPSSMQPPADEPERPRPRRRPWVVPAIGLLALLICVGGVVVAYQTWRGPADLSWGVHSSDEGGFAVRLPAGRAVDRFSETKSTRDLSMTYTFEGVSLAGATRMGVAYADLGDSDAERTELPQDAMEALKREYQGEGAVTWQFDIRLGRHLGKEVVYESEAAGSRHPIAYSRWFLVGRRLYDVTWMSGRTEPSADALHEFWDSFQLLDEPEAVVTVVETP